MKKILLSITGATLLILTLSLLLINVSAATPVEKYNYDIDNPMYVTSVKNQGEYGLCWAFSAISCCETEAIKNHGANADEIDFSEWHLAYFAYNAQKGDTGDVISTSKPFYEIGGDLSLPVFTLSNWIGLVNEDVAKYSDFLKNPDAKLDPSLAYKTPEYYIKNAYLYNYDTDIDEIKQAIMTYGAIQTSYFSHESFMNSTTSAYYCPDNYSMNHAICIIGWDDSYSRYNFKESARPSSDGAWLVKNSWSEVNGNDGYFWLSYEDKSLTNAIAYDVEPASTFTANNNYQHDGGFSLIYYEYETINAANIFKAKSNEALVAVSVFTHEADNSPYTLRIYKNPAVLEPKKFTEGQLIYQKSGIISNAGLLTIDLDREVQLNEGDTFIVCIETNALIGFDGTQALSDGSNVISQSTASVLKNQTYISVNGANFYDVASPQNSSMPTNARIKAYTKVKAVRESTILEYPTMKPIEFGQSLKFSELIGGEVVDLLTQEPVSGTWSFKDKSIVALNDMSIEIVFTPDDNSYKSFSKKIGASVIQTTPIFQLAADRTSYTSGKAITLSASVKNPHLDSVKDFGTLSCSYRVDNGADILFGGPIFNITNLNGRTLYITVTVQEVSGKYLPVSQTLEFPITVESFTNIPSIELPDIFETESIEVNETFIQDVTEIVTEIITNNDTNEITAPVFSDTESQSETLNEVEMESIKESIEESVKESVKEQIKDRTLNSLSCGSAISMSALFTVLALSATIITKKRKR